MISKWNKNRSFFSSFNIFSISVKIYELQVFVFFIRFGASTIQLTKLVPLICKLVSDSNGIVNIWNILISYNFFLLWKVRQQATDTLVEIYRHVGEKVRGDIAKRDIPEAK